MLDQGRAYLTQEQFVGLFYQPAADYACGELKLIRALFEGAVYDLEHYRGAASRQGRRRYDEAWRWITERETDWLFTFSNVCEDLHLDPSATRAALIKGLEQPPAVQPKSEITRRYVYCRCGCRSRGRWRHVCKDVYDEAYFGARGRPTDEQIMAVVDSRRVFAR